MNDAKSRVDNALIGAAGVHFVVSELSLRGLIALPTIRNTAGVDVVVVSADGSWHANLQVKTSRNKVGFWPVGKRYEQVCGKNNFYVFVRYIGSLGFRGVTVQFAAFCRHILGKTTQNGQIWRRTGVHPAKSQGPDISKRKRALKHFWNRQTG